jgi:hypothetical protein
MSLLDFQSALGRLVRMPSGGDPLDGLDFTVDERARLERLTQGPGFRFTVDVQRSWCMGRAAKAARLTLSLVPPAERQRLLDDWVNRGGGTSSFFAAEADAFLDFISARLPNPSHAQTLCRVEQATLRANEGARQFKPPHLSWLNAASGALRRGRHAMLVRFYAEPRLVLGALWGQPAPPLSDAAIPILFAPGLNGLSRAATDIEVVLWERLTLSSVLLSTLLMELDARQVIEALALAGAVEHFEAGLNEV